MVMRFFILIVFLSIIPFSAHAACEGYNNAMNALESAITQKNNKPVGRKKDVPPMASINAAIDDLEAAIKKHDMQKRIAPSQVYSHRQKPSL